MITARISIVKATLMQYIDINLYLEYGIESKSRLSLVVTVFISKL